MHLLIIDGAHMKAELEAKFGADHQYTYFELQYEMPDDWLPFKKQLEETCAVSDAVMCFGVEGSWNLFDQVDKIVFTESSDTSLSDTVRGWIPENEEPKATLFGFCGLPTLLNRPLLEVSLYNPKNAPQLAEICAALGTDYRVVQDRVGMVTPRVICMLINEACYTLQEGTATIQDIDKSMKLGTSYPRGPFEWANLMGVSRVYGVLEALWEDTHEERYKVCPLLKTMHLRGEQFTL